MFGRYTTPQTLSDPLSTNAFSYAERERLLGHTPQITITPWKKGSRSDISLGTHTVIQEIDHKHILQSHTGLEYNIYIDTDISIAIMDNHNHALGIWGETHNKHQIIPNVIHIDAHADLEYPAEVMPTESTRDQLRDYVHNQTHIGSFIQPAVNSGLIDECIQVRSSYALEHLHRNPHKSSILDIDLDFWMAHATIPTKHLKIIQNLIDSQQIILVTLATSPYFLDQSKALKYIYQLKPHLQSSP